MIDSRRLVAQASRTGPMCLAIGSGVCGLAMSIYWSATAGGSGLIAFLMLLFGLIPVSALAGAAAGLVLGPLAQWVVGVLGIRAVFWPVTQAVLMAICFLLIVLPASG